MSWTKAKHFIKCLILGACVLLFSCTAPRSVLNSGKVVPKKQIRFGQNYTFNISSSPIEQSIRGSYALGQSLAKEDTLFYNDQLMHLNKSFLAYCVDPIGYSQERYFRYGIGKGFDFGYKNASGTNTFDVMFQFLGSRKNFNESEIGGWYASVGLQYSWKNYRFLNYQYFDKIQRLFGLEMWRKDVSVPLIFSKSFGPEERVGCFSFGIIYTHSFIRYNISSENIYNLPGANQVPPALLQPISGKENYSSYGSFLNVKIGKKYVFFNFSLAAYYQNYGKYQMIDGKSIQLEGFTIVPSYGIQFNILPKQKKKVNEMTI